MAAVAQNGSALRFASEDLKQDRDIVFSAVSRAGSALQDAAEVLSNYWNAQTQQHVGGQCFSWAITC